MFNDIAAWAKDVISANPDANKVYDTVRIIENVQQLEQDFGTGSDDGSIPITRGWTIDVTRREPETDDRSKQADVSYTVVYRCFWLVTGRGASGTAFRTHLGEVATALGGVDRPTALATVSPNSDRRIAFPVATDDITVVVWPLVGGRRHHRATLTQQIVLREQIRT